MSQATNTVPERLLRHVVLFGFKPSATGEDIRQVEAAFARLPEQIEAIYDFEWGTDVSVENAARGYTHCFFVTFRSEADRDAYLPHPDHKAFGAALRPHLEQSLVLDYWTQR
ncbi:MAG: Dabb family protein [Caldilineaceae bacterium]|nr:Dabb family protein [Caldilineaceae bacterium]